jgi:hypothetical protein
MTQAVAEDVEVGADVQCAIRLWGLTQKNGFICVALEADTDVGYEDVGKVMTRLSTLADANGGFSLERDGYLYLFTSDWVERRTTDIEGRLLPTPSKLVDVDGSIMA